MAKAGIYFDPIHLLKVLDKHRVSYIVIGAFARVIHGADEVTDGLDILPSPRTENLRRLQSATDELGAALPAEAELRSGPVTLDTSAGEFRIVAAPEGTQGYDDLRRAATREPLGEGVRPSVASIGDLARMLAAHGDPTGQVLRGLRRVAELEAGRSVDL